MSGDPEAGIGWETVHVCLFRSPKPGKDPYIMAAALPNVHPLDIKKEDLMSP